MLTGTTTSASMATYGMCSYSRLLVRFPWVVQILVLLVVVTCGVVCVVLVDFPSFETPTDGFEARGTPIRGALAAQYNLNTDTSLQQPAISDYQRQIGQFLLPHRPRRSRRSIGAEKTYGPILSSKNEWDWNGTLSGMHTSSYFEHVNRTGNEETSSTERILNGSRRRMKRSESCLPPTPWDVDPYIKVVFASSTFDQNLFRVDALQAICAMDDIFQTSDHVTSGCASFSAASMVAGLAEVTCGELSEVDVIHALDTLHACAPSYYDGSYTEACVSAACPGVPDMCQRAPQVYYILHFLSDYGFLDPITQNVNLTYALMLVDVQQDRWVDFYREMLEDNYLLDSRIVKIVGIQDYMIKFNLFNIYMKKDIRYMALGGLVIVILMCLYLRSLFMTLITMLCVIFSIVIAYFLYFIAFGLTFFPFINIFVMLLLIAIGADDVFIFYDTWKIMKARYPEAEIAFWLGQTMNHAALSIFVTSLTTAAALLANLVSIITNIQCFGIFSTSAVLVNFLLMITWVPASIVLLERFEHKHMAQASCCVCYEACAKCFSKISQFIFAKVLPLVVGKLWFVCLPGFMALGIWGMIFTLYTPKLDLPVSANVKLFNTDHPFERYGNDLRRRFRYVQQSVNITGLPVAFVWGVHAYDNGDHLEPKDHGHLVLDDAFNLTTSDAWLWMRDFCEAVKGASFTSPEVAGVPCLMQLFETRLTGPCNGATPETCCQLSPPYTDSVFAVCFPEFLQIVGAFSLSIDVPYLDMTGAVVAYRLDIPSTVQWSGSYVNMQGYYRELDAFLHDAMSTAPSGLDSAWFFSGFHFYDLQDALASGTFKSIGVSLACATALMLMTSGNLLITLYAILSITFVIFVTVGVLVMLEWELNILESVIITATVGLSIDFPIHYGVAYRLAESTDRKERVTYALRTVGSPVTMAALTTFLAGTTVMPSILYAYQQLGIFLMVVMLSSWLFSTFFFLPMCRIIGPAGRQAQIPCCCNTTTATEDDKPPITTQEVSIIVSPSIEHDKQPMTTQEVNIIAPPSMEDDKPPITTQEVNIIAPPSMEFDKPPTTTHEVSILASPSLDTCNIRSSFTPRVIYKSYTDCWNAIKKQPADGTPALPDPDKRTSEVNSSTGPLIDSSGDVAQGLQDSPYAYRNPAYSSETTLRRVSSVNITH